ncbi:YibE/F family protein [Virgibacillus oceani]
MNTLAWLAVILLVLMVLIGGRKGLRSFIALVLNFGVIIISIFVMLDPTGDPVIVTIIGSTVISAITLFYINEVNSTTKTAFISTVITIVILIFFIVIMTDAAMIQGFSEEEIGELQPFSLYIGVDFVRIGASMIIISAIGAITDIAMSVASPMREIFNHNQSISRKELFGWGLTIGRDILGSNSNTLFFAFFGGYLALLIWFKDLSYSLGEIVNSKVFSAEMITILCAGIGIALAIPITSWITAYFLVKTREKETD